MRPGSGSTRLWVMAGVRWWTLGGRLVSVPEGWLEQAWGPARGWRRGSSSCSQGTVLALTRPVPLQHAAGEEKARRYNQALGDM